MDETCYLIINYYYFYILVYDTMSLLSFFTNEVKGKKVTILKSKLLAEVVYDHC